VPHSINLHRLWSGFKPSVIKIIECDSPCTQRSQVPVPPARHPLPLRFSHTRRCFNEWHIRRIAGDVLPRYLEMKSTGFKPMHQRDLNRRARERVEPAAPRSMPSSCSSPGLGYRRPEYKIPWFRYFTVYRPNPNNLGTDSHSEYEMTSQFQGRHSLFLYMMLIIKIGLINSWHFIKFS
jgi:hypothetical protein